MLKNKKEHPKEKLELHPRNRHRERYDFKELITYCPELAAFVAPNVYKDLSIDFANPAAVKTLNQALLKQYYGIDNWDIPAGHLCPPIPGRADYLHHIADLLASCNQEKIPMGAAIRCLDIGMGANCVYPIIGNKEYGWSFVGSDIDPVAVAAANQIITNNPFLQNLVECRLQSNRLNIFPGIIQKNEMFDLSICNPPFHASLAEAEAGTRRKLTNLNHKRPQKTILNFGGQQRELWTEGGEVKFVSDMVEQSRQFGENCFWFSSLISKESNLEYIYNAFDSANVAEGVTINMGQGNKISRVVAWTFLDRKQQQKWQEKRWQVTI